MKLEHITLLHEIEKNYRDTGEFLSVRGLKEFAKNKEIKVGTDKARQLLDLVKKKHSRDSSKRLEAMAAIIGKPLEEVTENIQHLALKKNISVMTKAELCTALCALRPYSYVEAQALTRDELRKKVTEYRQQTRATEFLMDVGIYADYEDAEGW